MLIFASGRTDIPAFYSQWFMNRIRSGFVDVRNPYFPQQVSHYILTPDLVDCIIFCTKNPNPIIPYIDELNQRGFKSYFFVSITPYGKDIEPNVPNKHELLDSFISLSEKIGINNICWRYDPIFVSKKYSIDYHFRSFDTIAQKLEGYTKRCIISFVDLYEKTKRNFPELQEVSENEQKELIQFFSKIGKKNKNTN